MLSYMYFLSVCLLLAGLHVSLCSPELPPANDNLNIYALPVGQGDCTVIQCPRTGTGNGKGAVTIIDAGTFKDHFDPKAFGNYLKGARIKYVILTHPHKDHYSLIDLIPYLMDIQKNYKYIIRVNGENIRG